MIKFHHLIKPLFWWLDLNVLNLRIMRLVLLIFSASILTLTIKCVVKKKIDLIFTFSLLLLSSLLTFTFGPKSLSYNSLSMLGPTLTPIILIAIITSLTSM